MMHTSCKIKGQLHNVFGHRLAKKHNIVWIFHTPVSITSVLGTLPATKLEKIVTDKRLCKDVAKLSGKHQTSTVEAFHSLIVQFAPKTFVYSYTGLYCRYVNTMKHTIMTTSNLL